MILTAILASSIATTGIQQPSGEARITLTVNQGRDAQPGTYEVRVYRGALRAPPPELVPHFPAGKGLSANWSLSISCIDRCTCPTQLTEDLGSGSPYDSGLMGVWQVLDENAAIVTTWQRGEGYEVRIYGCRAGRLERWLDEWSEGVATVSLDSQTRMPMVTALNRDGAQPVIWRWDGKGYASSGSR